MTREPPVIEAVAVGGDDALWRKMVREGRAAYRIEARGSARRRARLQSAKIIDVSGAFVCEAMIQDRSSTGLRLLLQRNCGLPGRMGVYVDLTGEILTAAPVWRRERAVGLRVLSHAAPAPLKASDRAALAGRYYAVPN